MLFSSQVSSALLLWVGLALAEDTGDPEGPPTPSETITIYGEARIARQRGEMIRTLKHLGYRETKRKNGRTTLRPRIPYRPTVVLDDDAWMQIKRSPIRIDPPGSTNWRYLWCLPPFTITAACIQVGGQVIGKRKLAHHKEDIVRATRYEMKEWQQAVVAHAMDQRLNTELPDLLDSIWHTGHSSDTDGAFLETPAQRREAIFNFWANRSCVPEGTSVRELVATYIEREIQTSQFPAPSEELQNANDAQRCDKAQPLHVP
jgi:hypothetical protein|tara:strand:- start:734 stop:1513 length:780 start_codon:yes stop_codon:yes gene_type:complete